MLLLLAQGLLNKIVNMSERRENISFYDFQVALASAGEIVLWKYIIGEERAAVNVKRREMAGSKKGDRKGDCSYKTPPHHNLATLIIIWSFILSQVLSSIFVSWERVVKKYSAHPLHSLVPSNANGVKCEDLFTLVVLLYFCNLTKSVPRSLCVYPYWKAALRNFG